jgi:hypothetical protein
VGELVLAAKVTHVPSMFISELPGPHEGCRADEFPHFIRELPFDYLGTKSSVTRSRCTRPSSA